MYSIKLKVNVMILILLFTLLSFLQNSPDDFILWEKNKLKKSDFHGAINASMNYKARSYTSTKYSLRTFIEGNSKKIFIEVGTYFNRSKSWFKNIRNERSVLRNQQLHFNISELFTRYFRKKIQEFTFSENYKDEISAIRQLIRKNEKTFRDDFIKKRRQSRSPTYQLKWKKYIDDELDKMETYKKSYLGIELKFKTNI